MPRTPREQRPHNVGGSKRSQAELKAELKRKPRGPSFRTSGFARMDSVARYFGESVRARADFVSRFERAEKPLVEMRDTLREHPQMRKLLEGANITAVYPDAKSPGLIVSFRQPGGGSEEIISQGQVGKAHELDKGHLTEQTIVVKPVGMPFESGGKTRQLLVFLVDEPALANMARNEHTNPERLKIDEFTELVMDKARQGVLDELSGARAKREFDAQMRAGGVDPGRKPGEHYAIVHHRVAIRALGEMLAELPKDLFERNRGKMQRGTLPDELKEDILRRAMAEVDESILGNLTSFRYDPVYNNIQDPAKHFSETVMRPGIKRALRWIEWSTKYLSFEEMMGAVKRSGAMYQIPNNLASAARKKVSALKTEERRKASGQLEQDINRMFGKKGK